MQETEDDSAKGYVLEGVLEYPLKLHDEQVAYPLAPKRLRVCPELMSQYQTDLNEDLERSSDEISAR